MRRRATSCDRPRDGRRHTRARWTIERVRDDDSRSLRRASRRVEKRRTNERARARERMGGMNRLTKCIRWCRASVSIEIGIGLTSFGCGFTALGVVFFFDRGLLAMGNLMFLSGVTLTIGPKQTMKFFVRPRNQRGAFCFLFGLALVLYGWPFFGLIVEGYGFVALFSAFFPTVLIFLKRVPVVGTVLSLPGVKHFTATIIGKAQQLPV